MRILKTLFVVVFVQFVNVVSAVSHPYHLHPVVIIPGLEGSQLHARLQKTHSRHFYCAKKSNWFTLWLNPALLAPKVIDCFIDNMMLDVHPITNRSVDREGVEIRIPGFGGTETVEFLGPFEMKVLSPFHTLVEYLLSLGYERGKSLRAAPYDFRKAPNDNPQYFVDLKAMIEETYILNDNKSSVVICHSMGCLFSLYFLQHQPQAWKDKHIKTWIAVAAPFGGAVVALKSLMAGSNLEIVFYDDKRFIPLIRSYSSVAFCLPHPQIFKDRPIFSINGTSYTARDIPLLLDKLEDKTPSRLYHHTQGLISDFRHPGVDVHCLSGKSVKTLQSIHFTKHSHFPKKHKKRFADGDGTVNAESSNACLLWVNEKGRYFHARSFHHVGHLGILWHHGFLSYISDLLLQVNGHNAMRR